MSLYSDPDYQGACQAFSFDRPRMPRALIVPDQVSSVRIGAAPAPGCPTWDGLLTLCQDDDFSGTCILPTADIPNLSSTRLGEDTLTSMQIPAGTYLSVYRDPDFQGECQSFSRDVGTLGFSRVRHDEASSIRISTTPPADCAAN